MKLLMVRNKIFICKIIYWSESFCFLLGCLRSRICSFFRLFFTDIFVFVKEWLYKLKQIWQIHKCEIKRRVFKAAFNSKKVIWNGFSASDWLQKCSENSNKQQSQVNSYRRYFFSFFVWNTKSIRWIGIKHSTNLVVHATATATPRRLWMVRRLDFWIIVKYTTPHFCLIHCTNIDSFLSQFLDI